MTTCPCCEGTMQVTFDFIFDNKHEIMNCEMCDCLYVRSLNTGEWIESSSLNALKMVGATTGDKKNRVYQGCTFRSVAS